jgi:molybdopterin converting factor subunit 1
MEITVRFYASLRDTAGISQCTLMVPRDTNLAEMVKLLVAHYPALDGHQASWHFAVNQTHARPNTILQPGDRVAVFPYVAGG